MAFSGILNCRSTYSIEPNTLTKDINGYDDHAHQFRAKSMLLRERVHQFHGRRFHRVHDQLRAQLILFRGRDFPLHVHLIRSHVLFLVRVHHSREYHLDAQTILIHVRARVRRS